MLVLGLLTTKLIDWFICSTVVKFFTVSSVNSLVSCAKRLLVWRNFDRRLGLFCPCGRKNNGFAGLGDTGGETSLAGFYTVMLFCSEFRETDVNCCNSSYLLEDCETQLMSSRTRVDDWLNWPSSSRLLTSSSKFSRWAIKFDWRFMTEFMLLELTFSIMMLSRFVFISSTLSLILLINKERVRKLFLCSTDICKRSSWFFMLNSVILNLFNAYCNFWLFSFVILDEPAVVKS